MNLYEALKVAAAAATFPRHFDGWPKSTAEESAEKMIREAGRWEILPEFRLLPEERAALAAEQRELGLLAQQQIAERAAKDAANEEARRAKQEADTAARLQKRAAQSEAGAAKVHLITAKVAYLGGGFYGIRVGRDIRPCREVVIPDLTSADKGREVTVEVSLFDHKII